VNAHSFIIQIGYSRGLARNAMLKNLERKMNLGKKKGQKYEQIIEAAVKVIAENGYHHAQVSKIAKEAGVADGTIYLYFDNKEDILISLFEEKMGQFISKTKAEITGNYTPEEKLRILIEMHFKQLDADHGLAIVTQVELRQSNAMLRKQINEILKNYLILMDEILSEGKESGFFSNELDLLLTRQMIFGTLDEVVTNWVMKERKYDLVSLAKPIHQLLLNGFAVKK
jgi:TetR/AcrR family fatty acid metabolism transcriptional regulator